jgi:hypothetical protein
LLPFRGHQVLLALTALQRQRQIRHEQGR